MSAFRTDGTLAWQIIRGRGAYMNILDLLDFPDFRDVRLFPWMQPHAQIQRVSTPEADLLVAGRLAPAVRNIIHWRCCCPVPVLLLAMVILREPGRVLFGRDTRDSG